MLQIQPDEGMTLRFSAKIPGPSVHMDGVEMEFNYNDYFKAAPSTGYETLIYDCMIGDATLFQRADKIEAGWRVVQPVLDAWAQRSRPGLCRSIRPAVGTGRSRRAAGPRRPALAADQRRRQRQAIMTRKPAASKISLVLADVDGTLLTAEKILTPRAIAAVEALRTAGVKFAITSGRPPRGMAMLIEPLWAANADRRVQWRDFRQTRHERHR